jgi:hypothetical protein
MKKKQSVKKPKTNIIGRPPMFKTPEEMQVLIDAYMETRGIKPVLNEQGQAILDTKGNPIWKVDAPTVAGLALYLGFTDRHSMYDYKLKPLFTNTIKKAVTRIEEFAEEMLHNGKPIGAIFWLKNHGWSDKQEIEQTTKTLPATEEDCKKELQKIADEQGISLEELMEREGLK